MFRLFPKCSNVSYVNSKHPYCACDLISVSRISTILSSLSGLHRENMDDITSEAQESISQDEYLYQIWMNTHSEHFLNRGSLWKASASLSEFQLKSSRFHFGICWNLCQNFPDLDRVKKSSHFKNTILTASSDSRLLYKIGTSVEP